MTGPPTTKFDQRQRKKKKKKIEGASEPAKLSAALKLRNVLGLFLLYAFNFRSQIKKEVVTQV